MNQFKKTSQKREKNRGIYFQIGFIIAGGMALLAFEWTSPIVLAELPRPHEVYEAEMDIPVIIPDVEVEKPKVKHRTAPKKSRVIKIVKTIVEPVPNPEPISIPTFDPNEFKEVEQFKEEEIYIIPEIMPQFEGGLKEMFRFLGKHLKYPKREKEFGVQGTVYLEFVVGKKGEIKNIKIKRGVNEALDKEAIRVLKAMPNWQPGKQHGKPVCVRYSLPIKFLLK